MERHGVPTAAFRVFEDHDDALRHLKDPATRYPLVVKADGLAAGKGVVVAATVDEAKAAVSDMLSGDAFGAADVSCTVAATIAGAISARNCRQAT